MSRPKCFGPWVMAFLFAVTVTTSAAATTVLRQDLSEQVSQAELIFVGTAVRAETIPTGDGAFAFTHVTFEVEETFLGVTRDRHLALQFAGGTVGNEVFGVAGMPTFAPGERYLLFVAGNGRYGCPLVGWSQGKLDVVAHPLTGESIVVDHAGRVIIGIGEDDWRRAAPTLTADRLLREPREQGVVVLEEGEGVQVRVDEVSDPVRELAKAAPASRVLADLHHFVRQRKAGARAAAVVESATPADVPANYHFRAVAPAPAPAPTSDSRGIDR